MCHKLAKPNPDAENKHGIRRCREREQGYQLATAGPSGYFPDLFPFSDERSNNYTSWIEIS
jgi:hypothetical protein